MRTLFLFWLFVSVVSLSAQTTYKTEKDISYISTSENDPYRMERCKLDIYYPENAKEFPTIVWFHGGGLTGGEKHIPNELTQKGFAVVAVNYRLSPRATHPAYIQDAAEAVAWTFKHIRQYGGNTEKIYVSGHSAGGYLCLMLALDKNYLGKHQVDADKVAAWFPLSGQTVTHYTIRKERKMKDGIPAIDEFAPIHHARQGTPPIHLITGDRKLEMMARYEENAHLYAVAQGVGNKNVYLYELQGFDHGSMMAPGCLLMVDYILKQ
ncbi:alpha/beta hydrolase [Bacteroides sp. 224]|uniref:alpha/beta hydrolase n=1 Tax=Bacteroides sp. 224 TaxID=2302936 RepID=UPI0013D8BC96|nr:alpha/beta hydrolase [Bacteroides sp. 224]NDV64754.1 alpha/beta hydrolase [Bacteroides sp. 224]